MVLICVRMHGTVVLLLQGGRRVLQRRLQAGADGHGRGARRGGAPPPPPARAAVLVGR
jgi:hypothetical protein